jgi:hypothetical protein
VQRGRIEVRTSKLAAVWKFDADQQDVKKVLFFMVISIELPID